MIVCELPVSKMANLGIMEPKATNTATAAN
jgi:hypothetical protein